ncbi:uncharacterized protein LOC110106876 [Dendrobium catenatum]|uniref:Tryptophan synthase alpha chain-like protein n=2 Tax=Dendrobium TaxID=37818 RepID=A0A7T0BR63_DENNO|nr:uncharacterized protein LOC110106876 [Dendrobium catenatum]XP_020692604.1 uncharacterized protein LOC110106876 [Dendrobium catenatum]PKU63340.1 hypothetical protein MA16_Dca013384 [Dendrobium catenatum]QPJ58198.1 tryptophan synthase alpha chain-like protein [Dendrobium nobile]QPJ58199.1 tryptophan synthase alpha chain-like protein [Dendrobium nobile]
MLGISYGELFLIIGATAALIGPKDLPFIAKAAGRLAGRAVGYVQMARGQFESVMQQSQVNQVHKELQDTMAQLEAIRYEIRGISVMNPIPFTRRLEGVEPPAKNGAVFAEKSDTDHMSVLNNAKDLGSTETNSSSIHSQAMAYARLAKTTIIKFNSSQASLNNENLNGQDGLPSVLPISAEIAGLLSKRNDDVKGSDILHEAIVEAEVAKNAKQFFSQPENQIPKE